MDEEKKKYLEELRKQIDPEVLSKMADYLGADKGATGSVGNMSSVSDSAADMLRERRATQFQEKVARRKRENAGIGIAVQKKHTIFAEYSVYILSSTDIWSRIIDAQFKSLGFRNTVVFSEFASLLRQIMENIKNESSEKFVIAVGFKEIKSFLLGWDRVCKEMEEKRKDSLISHIVIFMILESPKQVPEQFVRIIGDDHVISLTDDPALNKEKIERAITGDES